MFTLGEGSRIAKESAPKKVKRDSCVVDEAELIAKKDSLMLTTVDKPNEDHFQPLSNKPNANEKHTSGDSRHNVLCSETAIIPLLKDQEDETVLVKGLEQGKNSLPREHNEMSKIVDSGSQYQGMCWNIPIKYLCCHIYMYFAVNVLCPL